MRKENRISKLNHMNESTKTKSMGFALNQIETCHFDLKPCEFEWFFSYKYGNCFQFNNRKDKETTMGGLTIGLFLLFSFTMAHLIRRDPKRLK